MDIISYGIAGQADKTKKATQTLLGSGVQGTSPHVKDRIDAMENSIQKVTQQADQLIVNDTVNIMKAHAKLNSVAKTIKYKMQNMIFDDLLDLSGIDTVKSSGYTFDSVNGLISNGIIVTKAETADSIPTKAILVVEENNTTLKGSYSISRDGGTTFESITPEILFYFKDSISPKDTRLVVKGILPSGTQLLNYSLTWL